MENTSQTNINQLEEISLKEILLKSKEWFRFLLKKWHFIVLFGIIGGVIGYFYAISKKPIYTATTSFVLEDGDSGGGMGQYAGLAAIIGVNLSSGGGGIFQGDNIIELYKSRIMIEKTLLSPIQIKGKKLLLIDNYINFKNLRKKWAKDKSLSKINFNPINKASFSRIQDSILTAVVNDINKNYLTVEKPDKNLSIIAVKVIAENEYFAKYFNELLVENVNEFYTQTKTKKSNLNVTTLQRKVDSVTAVMNGAIYQAVAVSDATPNLNPTKQILRVAPAQKAQFTAEANKAILTELVKNLELSKISLSNETPLIQTIDTPLFPLDKEKFSTLKGIVIGSFLFGFISVIVLISRKLINDLMTEEEPITE